MTTSTVSDAELEIIVANRMSHKTVRDIAAELLAFRRARPDRAEVLREALKDALKDAAYAPGDHPVVPLKLAAFVERVRALSSPSREPTTQSTSQGK